MQAGAMQLAGAGNLHIEKKGTIDLVTEIDKQVEQMFRALIGERFPDHSILGEEFEMQDRKLALLLGLRSRRRHHELRARPAHLLLGARARNRWPSRGRRPSTIRAGKSSSRRSAARGVAERRAHACLFGDVADRCTAVHGISVPRAAGSRRAGALFGEFLKRARAVRRLGSAAIDLCYVAAGRLDGFWEQKLQPWDVSAGALLVAEAGGSVTNVAGGPFDSRRGEAVASNGRIHAAMIETIQTFKAGWRSRNWTQ